MGTVKIFERYITKQLTLPFEAELYTFGAQRMCNKAFQMWSNLLIRTVADATAFRFVNDYDVVPTVPPHMGGHRHAGGQLVILNDENPDFDKLEWLTDHLMGNYIDQLKRVSQVPRNKLKAFKAIANEASNYGLVKQGTAAILVAAVSAVFLLSYRK